MMKLIVGLGNPGQKYKNTRHNAGLMLVDYLKSLPAQAGQKLKLKSVELAKSDKFMNDSGSSVKTIIKTRKIKYQDLYVAHDDLDIKLGEFKIQFGRGPKVHNGIASVENELGTKDFWRIRIGIENRNNESRIMNNEGKTPGEKYVLEDFTDFERDILNTTLKRCADSLKMIDQHQMKK